LIGGQPEAEPLENRAACRSAEVVEFSPTVEHNRSLEVVARNLAAVS
jgi:hypothetical protein